MRVLYVLLLALAIDATVLTKPKVSAKDRREHEQQADKGGHLEQKTHRTNKQLRANRDKLFEVLAGTGGGTAGISGTSTPGYCNCDPSQLWLDIVFVVDTSNDMTFYGLINVQSFVQSVMDPLSLGSGQFHSRAGIVVYSKKATVVKNLDDMSSTDDIYDLTVPYEGKPGANVKSGLSLAARMLEEQAIHGRGARRIIVLVSSAYRDDDAEDPVPFANQFKNSGGTIITVEYVENGGFLPHFSELSSPSRSFTTSKGDFTDEKMLAALCDENCFCPRRLALYMMSNKGIPDGGCYEYIEFSTDFQSAAQNCLRKGGHLVTVHDAKKQTFLNKLIPGGNSFWIGLQPTGNGDKWADGGDVTYTNWALGHPVASKCSVSESGSTWATAECTITHNYICEIPPCDSTNFCL